MQDDQINKSVDDLIGQDPGAATTTQPDPTSGLSLGSNPSLSEPPSDPVSPPQDTPDDASVQPSEDSNQAEESETADAPQPQDGDATQADSASDDLEQIKQDALEQLSPIVSELDQSPEEKYRTLMMLIQASDDQTLIKSAYEAANKIDDKKVRAEALLNIINEINYFANKSAAKN